MMMVLMVMLTRGRRGHYAARSATSSKLRCRRGEEEKVSN